MFIDKPSPGLSYILLYIGLIVFIVAVPIFFRRFRKMRGKTAGVVFILCLAAALFFLVFLYSGFTTRYTMDSETLTLKSGLLAGAEIRLGDIKEITKLPTNWHALALALNRTGYCNRFSNGLRLTTDKTSYYLSPSDPVRFEEEIRSRQKRSSILRKNLIFK